jgi:hypothetical protein
MELLATYLIANFTLLGCSFAFKIIYQGECYVKVKHPLIWEILRATR